MLSTVYTGYSVEKPATYALNRIYLEMQLQFHMEMYQLNAHLISLVLIPLQSRSS